MVYEFRKRIVSFIGKGGSLLSTNNILSTLSKIIVIFKKKKPKFLFSKRRYLNRFRKFIFLIPIYNYKNYLNKFISKRGRTHTKNATRIIYTKKKTIKKISNFLLKIKLVDMIYNPLNKSKINKSQDLISRKIVTLKNLKVFNKTPITSLKVKNILMFSDLFFAKFLSLLLFLNHSILTKIFFFNLEITNRLTNNILFQKLNIRNIGISNLVPNCCFNLKFTKTLVLFKSNLFFKENIIPWTQTVFEAITGL